MEILVYLFLNIAPMLIGSCEDELLQLYKGLKAQQQAEFFWLERFHVNYCYRSYNGDRTRPNRIIGGDFTLFHHGQWHPHRYGTEADEQDAIVLFDKDGRYRPHLYAEEKIQQDTDTPAPASSLP